MRLDGFRRCAQTQEAQFCNDVEFYRGFQRLLADVTQFRFWCSDAAAKLPKPTRVYAPLGAPPQTISYQPDRVAPLDNEKRDALRFESELNVDHSMCCNNRMLDFAHLYEAKS